MPLYARDVCGDRVFALDPIDKNGDYQCPYCDGELLFVDAKTVTKHFRHIEECPFQHEPETPYHLAMKLWIKNNLGAELEQKIGNRVADGTIMDRRISIECQVSSISREEIRERTVDHNAQKFAPLWILGWPMKRGPLTADLERQDRAYEHYIGIKELYVHGREREIQGLTRGDLYYCFVHAGELQFALGSYRRLVYYDEGMWLDVYKRKRELDLVTAINVRIEKDNLVVVNSSFGSEHRTPVMITKLKGSRWGYAKSE